MSDGQFYAICIVAGSFVMSALVAAWQHQATATRRHLDAGHLPPRWLDRWLRDAQREGTPHV